MKNAESLGMVIVLAVLLVLFGTMVPGFATLDNLSNVLSAVSLIGLVACTMLFCLAGGDFDLSVGSTAALAGVLAVTWIKQGMNPLMAIAGGLLAGVLIGLTNGVVIARFGINALITTLATMQIVRGWAQIVTDGTPVGTANEVFLGLNSRPFPAPFDYPMQVWLMLLSFGIYGFILNRTVFGRNVLAIGGNRDAARLAGIKVSRAKIIVFMLQGFMAALAGILAASRVQLAESNGSQGLELQVISACVLGGVSLAGGTGTMTGVVVGVFIMGTVQNAMTLKSVPPFWQLVVTGGILLVAVLLDRAKTVWGLRAPKAAKT